FSTANGQAPRAPGMKYRHYAPKGDLAIVRGEKDRVVDFVNEKLREAKLAGEKTGVIAASDTAERYGADVVKTSGDRRDEEVIARRLYGILREFDDENVTRIYSESFGDEAGQGSGLGQAIMNRLLKAAGHQVISV
ncbi:MAG: threonylcarbamoyl-AMP synthase, partial [Lachnospiraceae bacterium]|nr:threonylcarbamoyl-AMP synthase [Lachnospiraceae bacterium]